MKTKRMEICLLRFDGDENEHFWKRISVVEVAIVHLPWLKYASSRAETKGLSFDTSRYFSSSHARDKTKRRLSVITDLIYFSVGIGINLILGKSVLSS